jgi:hypothetical protein
VSVAGYAGKELFFGFAGFRGRQKRSAAEAAMRKVCTESSFWRFD